MYSIEYPTQKENDNSTKNKILRILFYINVMNK